LLPHTVPAKPEDGPAPRSVGAFVRERCASFSGERGECLFDSPCAVLAGGRCSYFEAAVLPLGLREPERFGAAREAYLRQARKLGYSGNEDANECNDCKRPVEMGKQYCPDCRKKRRRAAKRIQAQRDRARARQRVVQKSLKSLQLAEGLEVPSGAVDRLPIEGQDDAQIVGAGSQQPGDLEPHR
jgi:hypothetical protein